MSEIKRGPAAAFASAVIALAVLAGCAREPSMASRSASAFREAQQKGETFEGAGHEHGHGAATPGGGQEAQEAPAAGHEHGATPPGGDHSGHSATEPEGAQHTGHASGQSGSAAHEHEKGAGDPSGHAGMDHGESPAAAPAEPQDEHAGHDMSPQAPPSSGAHAGHSPSPGEKAPAPAVASGQPAKTLSPDALDAPAPTSVLDAQRSAEMAGGGHAGHGAHGVGRYRHVDAGRGPGAYEGSEKQTPGGEPHQHDHPEGGEAAVYVCPMHPEVTSTAPGKCPKCGMALVERRKG